ncbi:MAG: helix-turn-helix domain-containing protein [Natronosporangium sp.]
MEAAARARDHHDLDAYLRATAGLTDRQVAVQLGVGRSTVSRERLAVLGRRKPGPRPTVHPFGRGN